MVIDAKDAILGELHLGLQMKKASAVIFKRGNPLMKTPTGWRKIICLVAVSRPELATTWGLDFSALWIRPG